MKQFRFSVVVEKDEDGYFVLCPELQGCYSQGNSFEEAVANIKDAIRLHVEDRLARDESVPTLEMVSLTNGKPDDGRGCRVNRLPRVTADQIIRVLEGVGFDLVR